MNISVRSFGVSDLDGVRGDETGIAFVLAQEGTERIAQRATPEDTFGWFHI